MRSKVGLIALATLLVESASLVARGRGRQVTKMSAMTKGSGKVLVVGNGPVFLLAAKWAAAAGYDTTIVAGSRRALYEDLLWSEASPPSDKLTILDVSDEDVEKFNSVVAGADGVIVAFDEEQVLSDSLLEVVVPESGRSRRLVVLSRNLNGKGLGPFSLASKLAANSQVWAGGPMVEAFKTFESKVRGRAAKCGSGTDLVIVRAGTLKGGGPGDVTDSRSADEGLSSRFYDVQAKDLVNWQLLFDCDTRGVELTQGDTATGPGLRAAFTAQAYGPEPGDTGRIAAAAACVAALARPDLAGKDFGVSTKASRVSPSPADWDILFDKLP